jgi:hypothetical protein
MANVKVCEDQWNGVKKEKFTWINDIDEDVLICQDGTSTWPFTTPTAPPYCLTVPKKSVGGKLPCQLKDLPPKHYTYNAGPCPSKGNPKTVIIT